MWIDYSRKDYLCVKKIYFYNNGPGGKMHCLNIIVKMIQAQAHYFITLVMTQQLLSFLMEMKREKVNHIFEHPLQFWREWVK